jgi:hypothetical protein
MSDTARAPKTASPKHSIRAPIDAERQSERIDTGPDWQAKPIGD